MNGGGTKLGVNSLVLILMIWWQKVSFSAEMQHLSTKNMNMLYGADHNFVGPDDTSAGANAGVQFPPSVIVMQPCRSCLCKQPKPPNIQLIVLCCWLLAPSPFVCSMNSFEIEDSRKFCSC